MSTRTGTFSLLQTWDLAFGTVFFARLILWLLWDKLSLVLTVKTLVDYLRLISDFVILSCEGKGIVSLLKRISKQSLEHFLGTSEVWSPTTMSDIMRHKLVCGDGASQQLRRVHIDKACVSFQRSEDARVLAQVSECFECPLETAWQPSSVPAFDDHKNASFQVNTRYKTLLRVEDLNNTEVCNTEYHFEQFGMYQLDLQNCDISIITRPVNAYLPIFWAFVILCFLVGLRLGYQSIYKTAAFRRFLVWVQLRLGNRLQLSEQEEDQDTTQLVETAEVVARQSRRVKSLDAFRGLSITVMIFVNYGGGSYYFFNHSPWNGLTVADLVFPWFVWIMGVSLAISTQSRLRNSVPRRQLVLRVLKRSAILILLGLIINSRGGGNDLRTLRLPGVLQRFGLTYVVVGVAESLLLPRQFPEQSPAPQLLDLTSSGWQWLAAVLSLGLYTAVTLLLPVPGCPTGYLGPGGLADGGAHSKCTGGAAMWVDVWLLGRDHIYQHPSSTNIYHGSEHDPEGLLGTLTCVFLCWLGVAAGKVLLVHKHWRARVVRWLVWSLVCGLIAGGLSDFSKNHGVAPINKNLWSISFVMATASMAFFLLSVMYILIDVNRFWSGSPFVYPGTNSILMYLGHEMMSGMFPWSWKPYTDSHAELLAMNIWGCSLWILASYILHKKKMFLAL